MREKIIQDDKNLRWADQPSRRDVHWLRQSWPNPRSRLRICLHRRASSDPLSEPEKFDFYFLFKILWKSTRYVFRRNILELNSVSSILFISLNNKISGNLNVPHCSFSLTSQYQVFLLQQHSFLFPIQSSQIISNKILSGWVHTEGFHIFSKRGFKTRFYLFIYLQFDDVISICIWKST